MKRAGPMRGGAAVKRLAHVGGQGQRSEEVRGLPGPRLRGAVRGNWGEPRQRQRGGPAEVDPQYVREETATQPLWHPSQNEALRIRRWRFVG